MPLKCARRKSSRESEICPTILAQKLGKGRVHLRKSDILILARTLFCSHRSEEGDEEPFVHAWFLTNDGNERIEVGPDLRFGGFALKPIETLRVSDVGISKTGGYKRNALSILIQRRLVICNQALECRIGFRQVFQVTGCGLSV